jgi:hypothetical protein
MKKGSNMPNWCFNTVKIIVKVNQNNVEDIAKIKAQLNQPFVREHENWNPKTAQMEVESYTYDNPVFSFWNIVKPTDMETYLKQPDRNIPLEEQLKFQGNDWYSWNVRNWGTKWDVGLSNGDKYPDTELIVESDRELIYRLNTAWSPPVPAIENLSRQYPDLAFYLEYQEETGWGGEMTIVNGEIVQSMEYESMCPECDTADSLEWKEEEGKEECIKCNYVF